MTRKDYTAIATAVAEVLRTCEEASAEFSAVSFLATKLADVCQADNVRFDREKFLTACELV